MRGAVIDQACHRPRRPGWRCRVHGDRNPGWFSVRCAVSIQPVGLPGEARNIALVRASQAVEQFCPSPDDQRPALPILVQPYQPAVQLPPPGSPGKYWARSARRSPHCRRPRSTICRAVTTASMAAPGMVMRSMPDIDADGALVKTLQSPHAEAGCRVHWCKKCLPSSSAVMPPLARMKGRCHQIGLAEPERQDVGIAQSQGGDFGNAAEGSSALEWRDGWDRSRLIGVQSHRNLCRPIMR